jgi:urease beta subunit
MALGTALPERRKFEPCLTQLLSNPNRLDVAVQASVHRETITKLLRPFQIISHFHFSETSIDRFTDPARLAVKVVGVRDRWARSDRAKAADRHRGHGARRKE